jgi:hypothetical protein
MKPGPIIPLAYSGVETHVRNVNLHSNFLLPLGLGANQYYELHLVNGVLMDGTIKERWIGALTGGISKAFTNPFVVVTGEKTELNEEVYNEISLYCHDAGILITNELHTVDNPPEEDSGTPSEHSDMPELEEAYSSREEEAEVQSDESTESSTTDESV